MTSNAQRAMRPLILLALAVALPGAAVAKPAARSAAPAAAAMAVRIKNMAFSAPVLRVKAGTTVTWINGDQVPHNVAARDNSFRSKFLALGESFSFKFTKKGEFAYFCAIHPQMVGKIIVT